MVSAGRGLWVACTIGASTWWRDSGLLFVGSLVVLVAVEIAFLTRMQRRHGAMPFPGRGRPPREIRAIWVRYLLALPVVVVALGLVRWLAGAVAAFVLVTAGLWYYERRYAVAAAKVRERLG